MTRRLVVAALALAAIATTCARSSNAVVVGAVYPTRGSQGPGGLEEYHGVQLAAELANRHAVRPIRLELTVAESRDDAPQAVERLASKGIDVVVGSYGSTIARAAANAASRLGLVFWETGAVGDLDMGAGLGKTAFRVPASGRVLGRDAVTFVRERLGLADARYAVAYADDDYGRSVGHGALEAVRDAKMTLGADLPYDPWHADFDGMARTLIDRKIDVLVVAAYLADGTAIRRAVVRNHVPLKANIGTSSSYCMPAFGKALGRDAVGVFASDKPDGEVLNTHTLRPEALRALRWAKDAYRKRFRANMSAAALSGFAGAWALFTHVIPAAHSGDARRIAAAARNLRLPSGALPNGGGLHFAKPDQPEPGTNELGASVILEWVAPRQRAVVWPPAFATHDVVR